MTRPLRLPVLAMLVLACSSAFAQVSADPDFDATVKVKTYGAKEHPLVVIDEAHNNLHTADGLYKPLATLLTNDGYTVEAGKEKFQPQTLRAMRVLIVANARPESTAEGAAISAFTDAECDIVRDWVIDGGSLLLIADHAPFGTAANELAKRFGVSMGKGIAFDLVSYESLPTFVAFSADHGQLGDHPILKGLHPGERIKRVVAFGGQSLSVPGGATALLKFGPTSLESENQSELQLALEDARARGPSAPAALVRHATPAAGRAQAVALVVGTGRVVVAGEAGMFSAQIAKGQQPSGADLKFGMNTAGNDDKQFALNVLHWLSRAK
ncbi:MAG TPA: hypothetical protein VG994_18755 [Steroidobacteraceae bacterium]|nr:hypothetical protein [Steroidobacteraceae bacterium]